MKGVKKCFLFSFILMAVSLVSCLVFSSEKVYALRHDIKAIPLYSNDFFTGGCSHCSNYRASNPPFEIQWANSETYADNFEPTKNSVFYSNFDSSSSLCRYNGQRNDGYFPQNAGMIHGWTWHFNSYRGFYDPFGYESDFYKAQCQQPLAFGTANPLAVGYLVSVHPLFNSDSFYGLTPVTTQYYKDLLPYYYDYSHFYVSGDSVTSPDTGITYSSSFHMSDIFGNCLQVDNENCERVNITKFSKLVIPLGQWDSSKEGALTQGRSIEFRGSFNFPGVTQDSQLHTFSWASDYLTNGEFKLYLDGLVNENGSSSNFNTEPTNCDLNRTYIGTGMLLEYSCSLTLLHDYEQASLYLKLENPVTGSYIFDTNSDWTWSGFYIVTDHDETPGPAYNDEPTGNHLDEAPGNPYAKMEEAEGDDGNFFDHLINLFGFSFFNPFAPLFTMFTDSNTCANIPIIAGMLHSEESTYCSWFSSETRGILTPVLGIAGMMLVFGFAVRWLGASSGNLFEDAGHIEPPGYSATGGTAIKHGWRRHS